jgi:hypothetical protein
MIPKIDCADAQSLINDYQANLLQLHDKLKVAQHLSTCKKCSQQVRHDDPQIHVAKHQAHSH